MLPLPRTPPRVNACFDKIAPDFFPAEPAPDDATPVTAAPATDDAAAEVGLLLFVLPVAPLLPPPTELLVLPVEVAGLLPLLTVDEYAALPSVVAAFACDDENTEDDDEDDENDAEEDGDSRDGVHAPTPHSLYCIDPKTRNTRHSSPATNASGRRARSNINAFTGRPERRTAHLWGSKTFNISTD